MSEFIISADPASKDGDHNTIVVLGRNYGKNHIIRLLQKNEGYIVVDDLDDFVPQPPEQMEVFKRNYLKFIETHCFPRLSEQKSLKPFTPDRQNIRKGVKKRYQKVPRIL